MRPGFHPPKALADLRRASLPPTLAQGTRQRPLARGNRETTCRARGARRRQGGGLMALTEKTIARRKARFLKALATEVTVVAACRASALPHRTAYEWREQDPQF